jgi:predicted phosphodiesterase
LGLKIQLSRLRGKTIRALVTVPIVLAGLFACRPTLLVPLNTDHPPPTLIPTPFSTATATISPSPARPAAPSPTTKPTDEPTIPPTDEPTNTPVILRDVTIVRGPYLQSVTTDSVIVIWETDQPSYGQVVYGETEVSRASAIDPGASTRHAITLTDLKPYTLYHYHVESNGTPLSEKRTFRTAAGPDQTQFTFVALGDTRTQHQVHRTVAEGIVAAAPDFVLHTGDLVESGSFPDHWETFFQIEQELMACTPLFPALGNHEENDPLYFDLFYLPGNERWYTFDYGNARFICLQIDGYGAFDPGSEQYAWLEGALAANTQAWLFVYFHVPPYTSVEDAWESPVRQSLSPLFERYGVDLVLNGHKHNYERNEVNGITYVVTGGGGAPLYAMQEQEPTQAAFALAHHFVLLEIDGDHLTAMAISNEDEMLDRFERNAD